MFYYQYWELGATGIVADFNQKKPEILDVEKQKKLIKERLVSIIVASPFYLDKISIDNFTAASVRKVITGGAPVFPRLARKIVKSFNRAECLVAFGSTEAEPISSIDMKDVQVTSDGLSVGQIHHEIECKIIKIQDEAVSLESQNWQELVADFGEIVVSGPHVLKNYYNSQEAFMMNKIVDGEKIWHRTGDSGRIIGECLYLSGRVSQLHLLEGEYQSLFLTEYKLSQIPGVEIGTMIGNVVCVELTDTIDKSDAIKAIKNLGLADEEVKFIAKMPRDKRHHSKIDYTSLQKSIGR